MTNTIMQMLGLALVIVLVNAYYIAWQLDKQKSTLYTCKNGDYKGQTHDIKDWRKIAIELAKTTKNSRLNAIAKHGTDEDIIGLLYLNFGVELYDNEAN